MSTILNEFRTVALFINILNYKHTSVAKMGVLLKVALALIRFC